MEITTNILIITTFTFITFLIIPIMIILFNWKYILLGWRLKKGGERSALMFVRPEKGDLEGPFPVKKGENSFLLKEGGEKTFIYDGQAMQGAKMFGKPWFIYDLTDTKVTNGLYYHQNMIKEIEGESKSVPIYGTFQYVDEKGTQKIIKNHPYLSAEKNSITNPPKLVNAVIATEVMAGMAKEFFLKYKNIFYIVAGIGIGIAILIYLVYEWLPKEIAQIVTEKTSAVISEKLGNIPK